MSWWKPNVVVEIQQLLMSVSFNVSNCFENILFIRYMLMICSLIKRNLNQNWTKEESLLTNWMQEKASRNWFQLMYSLNETGKVADDSIFSLLVSLF